MALRKKLVYNTALLTCSSVLMSCIGMAFQIWLVGRIGTAGIGLYQLVCSVNMLCATLAISGAFFGFAAAIILWSLAEPVGFLWIGDARTVLSLRISAFSMPCVSLCSAFSGYFTACGRVWKPTLVHLAEQLAGIALVALFLGMSPAWDIEKSCAAVMAGRLAADILSLLLMAAVYAADRRSYCVGDTGGLKLTARMLKIALPLAVSAYARSALSTMQHLLVPQGLKAAGYSSDGALAGYGTIQGMVLPIVLFPSCIMSAVAELIIPELTEAQVRKDERDIRRTVASLFRMSLLFSGAVAVFMFLFADILGMVVYQSGEAGHYIRLLSPLIPVMYTDMTVDGCLKGLGQQVWSMGINILDALAGLLLVWWLLPRYALSAYIGIIYFGEILNFVLSVFRLWQTGSLKVRRSAPGTAAQRSQGQPGQKA